MSAAYKKAISVVDVTHGILAKSVNLRLSSCHIWDGRKQAIGFSVLY